MKVVTNLHSQPIMLSDGTMLAAAGTDGSVKTVAELSDGDKAGLLRRELIAVVDQELKAVQAPGSKPKVPSVETSVKEN